MIHSKNEAASRHILLLSLTLVLLLAALLRIGNLSHSPAGFSSEEIDMLRATDRVREAAIQPFYEIGDPRSGYEGLFAILQTILSSIIGDGLLCYRVLAVWCGLLSVALTFTLTRRLFGNFAGVAAAIALAVSFWPVLLSRIALREALVLPLMLTMLLLLARSVHLTHIVNADPPATPSYALLGLLIALLAYSHWTGLIALPITVVYFIYLVRARQPISRRATGALSFAGLLMVIVSIPYIVFTLRLPRLSGLFAFWANRPANPVELFSSITDTILSLFMIGERNPLHNLVGLPLIGPLGAVLFLFGLYVALRRFRAPNMAFVLIALGFGLFPDMWSSTPASFPKLTVALPALTALIGLGAAALVAQIRRIRESRLLHDGRTLLATGAIAALSAVLVGHLNTTLWTNDPEVDRVYHGQLGRIAGFLDRTHDGLTTTICSFNVEETAGQITDMLLLERMMHRTDPSLRFANCLNAFVLTRGGIRQRVAFANAPIDKQLSPVFASWLKDARPVQDDPLRPGIIYEIMVEKQLADMLGKVTAQVIEWSPNTTGPSEKAALPVRMGGYLTFEGYTLDNTKPFAPGQMITVATYWRADGNQIPDLRIFIHLQRNPNIEPILQNDTLSIWPEGLRDRDIFIQLVDIPLPTPFPEGEYYLSVGAYSDTTGQRFPVYDIDQPRGDRLFLTTIMVQN